MPSNHLSVEPESTFQELVLRIPNAVSSCLYHQGKPGCKNQLENSYYLWCFHKHCKKQTLLCPLNAVNEALSAHCGSLHKACLAGCVAAAYGTGRILMHCRCQTVPLCHTSPGQRFCL